MKELLKKYGLEPWFNSLKKSEQELILNKYGEENDTFNGSAAYWLASLSSWVNTKENAVLCGKIIHESEKLLQDEKPEDLYFIYIYYVGYYYKNRDEGDNEIIAVEYMEKAVSFSSQVAEAVKRDPFFSGFLGENPIYKQLIIVYKKRKEWGRVIELCNKGESEGWQNDFNKYRVEAEGKK